MLARIGALVGRAPHGVGVENHRARLDLGAGVDPDVDVHAIGVQRRQQRSAERDGAAVGVDLGTCADDDGARCRGIDVLVAIDGIKRGGAAGPGGADGDQATLLLARRRPGRFEIAFDIDAFGPVELDVTGRGAGAIGGDRARVRDRHPAAVGNEPDLRGREASAQAQIAPAGVDRDGARHALSLIHI